VKVALDRFGAVHVLIANAGILRDKSFASMSEKEWDQVVAVHLRYDRPFPVEPSAETHVEAPLRQLTYSLIQARLLTLTLCAVC
jgi:NAD(P)-dependent dehydrogenase (short-subunit alcohol dehydrogenase family)